MDKNSFYEQRNLDCETRIDKLLLDVPDLCQEFIMGIESRTTALTRLNYCYDLRLFFNFLRERINIFAGISRDDFGFPQLERVNTTHIEAFISYLSFYSPDKSDRVVSNKERAKARKLSTLKCFFKYFYNKDKLSKDVASKVQTPKIHTKEIVRLDGGEVEILLDSVEDMNGLSKQQENFYYNTRIRDMAILTLFLGTGIRISELVGINIDDFDFNKNEFIVTRKGGNRTVLYFSDEVKEILEQYYRERVNLPTLSPDEPAFFLSLQKKRIGVRAVENMVKKYTKQVFPLKNISPHKLRSTFGTKLYQETEDIYVVAEVLGHRDVNTTRRHYAAQSEQIKRKASEVIKLRNADSEED